MPNRIFVDSVFVIALVNQRDEHHAEASELADRFANHPLITTDSILLEIGNALSRSYKQEAIEVIDDFLVSSETEIVRLDERLFESAFAIYKSHRDKTWGLVDCVSFVVMREAGVRTALTCDKHFEQAGFEVLMGGEVRN